MTLSWTDWPRDVFETFRRGTVIPAHLLALDEQRHLDARRQRALSRYYIDAGAGGMAVGVHSTQFAIREKGLYAPVLKLAADAPKAGMILRDDHYGWFERVGRGRYRLTTAGEAALLRWALPVAQPTSG